MPKSKVEVKKPHIEESRNCAPVGINEAPGENHNFASIQYMATNSDVEDVDIDAQVEAAKKLLKNIRMRNNNQGDSTTVGQATDAAANGEMTEEQKRATSTQTKFNQNDPDAEKLIDS